jgi:hypothetical protein
MVVTMRINVLWDLMVVSCLVDFGGTLCLYLQGE